jgi:hypothetical protein
MSTIPVSEVVRITPNVLPAGGDAIALTGLVLTTSIRVPIGQVLSFSSPDAVGAFFGESSAERRNADVYFDGFEGATKRPGAMLFAQYNTADVAAYLRGGNISGLTLDQLKALNGPLSVTIDGVVKNATINLSGATSFSDAANIIANALGIDGAKIADFTGAIAGTTLTVTGYTGVAGAPPLAVGAVVKGAGVAAGTYITALVTGTGGNGTYTVNATQNVAAEAMTADAAAVTYDSVSGAFSIFSGTSGAASTISYGSGALATDLLLTAATGAVLSQGAVAATPAAFMNGVVQNTRAFATFMLNFNPDQPGENDVRYAFAQWNSTQARRFAFVVADDDGQPAATVPATTCLAQRVKTANLDGCSLNWQPADLQGTINYGDLCAFVCGTAAAIDFTATDGRITFKFRRGSIEPGVTDEIAFNNLTANGYNCYGAYADGDGVWQWYADGTVSGDFDWMDSYVNQIWLNGSFRNDLVTLLLNTNAIPYNAAGRALIEAGLADTINQGLVFGAYRAGVTLSASQKANVNTRAGKAIADTLSNQGWYLDVQDAPPAVRQVRGSPPMTFYYVDGQAVHEFDMASIALQ